MNVADFILIQINKEDEYYELARIRPYLTLEGDWDKNKGYYYDGFGQNNRSYYEFSLHLGKCEDDIKYKFKKIDYPFTHEEQKVRV